MVWHCSWVKNMSTKHCHGFCQRGLNSHPKPKNAAIIVVRLVRDERASCFLILTAALLCVLDCQLVHLRENQDRMNNLIKSFASKIPEHVFYTAIPQLISRIVHGNADTSKNVALILRTVLVKYPHQSLWSCGWLRFSKSKEKKQAGDVSFIKSSSFVIL